MARVLFAGGAKNTTIAQNMTASDPGIGAALTCNDLTGWPDPAVAGEEFLAVVDRDLPTEEKVRCSARDNNIVTILERGADGTTPTSHTANSSTFEHVLDAESAQRWEDAIIDVLEGAVGIPFTPVGTIAASNVQAAIAEVATDAAAAYAPVAHDHTNLQTVSWHVKNPTSSTVIAKHRVRLASGQAMEIASVESYIVGGTSVVFDVKKGSTIAGVADVTGFTAISADSDGTTTDATDVVVADGDWLTFGDLVVTGTVTDLVVTLVLEEVQ